MRKKHRSKAQSWFVKTRKNYYSALNDLGLDATFQADGFLMEAVLNATQQEKRDIEAVYKHVAIMTYQTADEVEEEIERRVQDTERQISKKYGAIQAKEIRERYFGDEYADVTRPDVFIFGLARYLKQNR